MSTIHKIGNQFWIAKDWHQAAEIQVDYSFDTGKVKGFRVNFGSIGAADPEYVKLRAQAIIRACEYAEELNKSEHIGADVEAIREEWRNSELANQEMVREWYEYNKKRREDERMAKMPIQN
jgi:hypothetical protein